MADNEDDFEQGGGSQLQIALLQNYLAFGKGAVRIHWRLSVLVGVVGIGLTVAAMILFPRTYKCTTVLMSVGTPVLDGINSNQNPLANAEGLIMRRENLEAIVRDTHLVQNAE